MNKYIKSISLAAGCLLAGTVMQSCALDEPFGKDGEGSLQMKLVINSDVTRAENDPADLSANCVVYISGSKGLLHKYQGLENVPEQISLKTGHYVAEAWTGDSVSASFDKKFFRGYQPFDMQPGMNQIVLNCKIANVVASINSSSVDAVGMRDFNIKVENSRASLDFNADNYKLAKGYYMMPDGENQLKVTVTGKSPEGKAFTATHVIENVERAHEYVINFSSNPSYDEMGGAFITISIDDTEVYVESEVQLFSRPAVLGVGFDANKQIIGNAGAFALTLLKVNAFGGIKNLLISSDDFAAMNLPENKIDLKHCTPEVANAVNEAGLTWDETFNEERNLAISYLTLSEKFLNALPERDSEYVLDIEVTDTYGKSTAQTVRFAVGEGAVVIEDPVMIDDVPADDLMAVLSTRATLSGSIVNPEAVNPGIRYRVAGSAGDWMFAAAPATVRSNARRSFRSAAQAVRSGGTPFSVKLTGLLPGTRYEYQAIAEGFNSESKFFTTEGKFIFPNASMEDWSNYVNNNKVRIPSADGQSSFWDSGNHGSTMASVTLTDGSTDMFHTGSKSCKMRSQKATVFGIGKFAAGNMFTGTFQLDGTDGILDLGRSFDGSHPDKLRVWVNYRPGPVQEEKETALQPLRKGDTDHGQIYVALTNEIVKVMTKKSKRQLFDPTNPAVLGYGEVSWTANYGADGILESIDIPIEYRDAAKTSKPLYVIVVCTASKYGDYFVGGEGSTLYADDFEFIYE